VVLLVVHGGPGISDHKESFEGLKSAVHQCHWDENCVSVVVFYDQLGCGKSDKPTFIEDDYSLESYVEELHQVVNSVIERHAGSPICILGHSWGGQILLEFLLSSKPIEPSVICGIVSNTALNMHSYEQKQKDLRASLEEATRQYYEQEEEKMSADKSVNSLIYKNLIGIADTQITGKMKGWEVLTRLSKLQHPCLFISGDDDVIPFEE